MADTPEQPEPAPEIPPVAAAKAAGSRTRGGALAVSAGIFLSRMVGLVREHVFAAYLGNLPAADAFRSAIRIPNALQNLLGEGVLSASFVPVYTRLRAGGEDDSARQLAGAVFGLLAAVTALLAVTGVLLAPLLVSTLAPGFEEERRQLTITLVRILFPSTGILVLSAWCLGILNSHRRFLLSYSAPVIWSICQMAALWIWGKRDLPFHSAEVVTWGVLTGSGLQFLVQLRPTLRLLGGFLPSLDTVSAPVRQVLKTFVPVVVGRGVVQVSALVDNVYASYLPPGSVSALSVAQVISLLPISLFGMSVAAAELPELALMGIDSPQGKEAMRSRVIAGMERVAFFAVPSAAAFLGLGDVVVSAIYQSGKFGPAQSRFTGYVLLGAGVGLVASATGRLCSSALYALKDAQAPFRYAIVRVVLNLALGYPVAMWLPHALGLPAHFGAVGLTLLFGVAAWVEFQLLRRRLESKVGTLTPPWRGRIVRPFAALLGIVAGLGVKWLLLCHFGSSLTPPAVPLGTLLMLPRLSPVLGAAMILGTFGITYLLVTTALGLSEPRRFVKRFTRR